YNLDGKIYIPLRMICTGLGMQIDYIEHTNSVVVNSIRDHVGIFNSDGVAVARRGNKYGLVNKSGELLTLFTYDEISNYDNPLLFKVTYDHRCGLIDTNGKLLTDIVYNEIRYESPSSIFLRIGNRMGMCDINGEIIIPVKYDDIAYCGNLIAMVKQNGKWYILNCSTQELSARGYDQVYKVTTGVQSDNDMIKGYYVENGGKWGYVDSFGNVVINPKYDALDKFDARGRARVISNNKIGIVDCGGRVLIPTAYDYLDSFGETDVAVAQVGQKFGVINDKFEVVVPFEYEYIYPFNNSNSTVAYKNEKFGIISTTGEHLTNFDYKYMEEFKNGLTLAYKDGYGYLDHNGNEIIECVHTDVKQGTALSVFLQKDNKWALFSPTGQNLTGFNYLDAGSFSNGLSAVSVVTDNGPRYGYVNDSGDCVINFEYDAAQSFKYGKAVVTKGKYSGIIDIEGNTIIPFVYTGFNPSYEHNVIAAANEYSQWGLISLRNEKLCEFKYDSILEFENGYAYVIKNHKFGIINNTGLEIVPPTHKTKEDAAKKIPQ
ncbi:MAG: WG repeat-containing protein, partial [Ruminococcaceae bacterium]|nr:WG repeat-containing protein [Oscillospiraceae bacterium]